ncbi:MAG: squalene synthase HpnC [Planctomycetota bacterium]
MAILSPDVPPIRLLADFGPERCGVVSQGEARSYAVGFARASTENFVVLSRLLPEDLVEDFAAVYAFCRWADDLGDERDPSLPADATAADVRSRAAALLGWFREELRATAGDEQRHPVLAALAPTIERHRLPLEPFEDLIEAFEMDQRVARYRTWNQLLGYCTKSANPVGRLVLMLAGLRSPEEDAASKDAWRQSDAICTALQITNHIQDVRRDLLERDRVYLPLEDIGLAEADLHAGIERQNDHDLRVRYIRAVRPLVTRTHELYDAGEGLPSRVGGRLGLLIGAMAQGGRETLREVERRGCATLWQRPVLPAWRKLLLVAGPIASLYCLPWRYRRPS